MAFFRACITILATFLALLVTTTYAQSITPSNDTSDIAPYVSSPRFWVNGTGFDHFRIIPLGWYSQISQQNFLTIDIDGRLTPVDPGNANSIGSDAITYVSCDPEDYPGVLAAADVVRMVAQRGNTIILYSTRADHCEAGSLRAIATANGIFSTLDPVLAASVADQISNSSSGIPASINPDTQSFLQYNSSGGNNQPYSGGTQSGPTTAVAMIILYTITGIITILFVVIIVTGAVRAHRHPERYGPSNVAGRPRRTRAKGIARAMLDTIPIVKFGDKEEPKKEVDIELSPSSNLAAQDRSIASTAVTAADASKTGVAVAPSSSSTNADGTDEAGQLGCSICTEDFNKGEEVRVLPCNHKFHPECVDPWLLNVSGTCPLCRIDLRPKNEQLPLPNETEESGEGQGSTTDVQRTGTASGTDMAPPLGSLPNRLDRDRRANTAGVDRRDTVAFASLRSVASGSREDRIAALRRFRQQRRTRLESNAAETTEQGEERRGLSTRLRERFRIRTGRQGEDDVGAEHTTGASNVSTAATRM